MKWLSIIAGFMAIIAMLPLPSDYYLLLRWVLCGVSIFVAYGFNQTKLQGWALTFGAIAILFNPIFPIYLYQKSFWIGIDLLVGLLFLIASGSINKQ